MFRASLCPSSGEQDVCYCMCCAALFLLDVVGSGCGALPCGVRALWRLLTVASCWFSLSLHNLLTMHGHRNLKHSRIFFSSEYFHYKLLRKLKWQIPGEPLAARYNWCQGPVPGRGPAAEKHWSRQQLCSRKPLRNVQKCSLKSYGSRLCIHLLLQS